MKRIALICLLLLSSTALLPGCFFKEAAPPSEKLAPARPVDWSKVNIPGMGEEGNRVSNSMRWLKIK